MRINAIDKFGIKGEKNGQMELDYLDDEAITKKYRDNFYGKRRIAFILLLLATILVYKATSILLAISTITEHPFELTNVSYDTSNPAEITLEFRINNYFSPIPLQLNKAKILINHNIKIITEDISISKDSLVVVKAKIKIAYINLCNFDSKNFLIDLEFEIKTNFLYIPLLFITRVARNVEIKTKGGIDKKFYDDLQIKTEFISTEQENFLVVSIPKQNLFKIESFNIDFDIRVEEITIQTVPNIFDKILIRKFEYSKIDEMGDIDFFISLNENSDILNNFILDFVNEDTQLIIKSISKANQSLILDYDPLYSVNPVESNKFADFLAVIEKIKFENNLTFEMKFGKESYLESLHYYAYLILKNMFINFSGKINTEEVLLGSLQMNSNGFVCNLEFKDFTQVMRLFLYREPMISLEILDSCPFLYNAVNGMKILTNFVYDYQFYYQNKIAPFFLKTHSFLKNINLTHKISEYKNDDDNQNFIDIHTESIFRDRNAIEYAASTTYSTFIKIDIPEDILFEVESAKLNGTMRISKTVLYFDMILDAFNNRIFGEFKALTNLIIDESAFDPIIPLESKITVSEILGEDLVIRQGTCCFVLHNFLLSVDEFFENMPCYLDPENYFDKSLYFKYDDVPHQSKCNISKFNFAMIDFENLCNIKIQCQTAQNHQFQDYYSQRYPIKNHKMLIVNEIEFPPCSSLIRGNFKMERNTELAQLTGEKAILLVYLLDGDFFIELKEPCVLSIKICNSFMDATEVEIDMDQEESYFGAFITNVLKYLIFDTSTNIKVSKPVENFNKLYFLKFKMSYSEDFYLKFDIEWTIPSIILDSSQIMEVVIPDLIRCIGITADGLTILNFQVKWIKTVNTYKLNMRLKILIEPDQYKQDFDVLFTTTFGRESKEANNPLKASDIVSYIGGFYPLRYEEYIERSQQEKIKIIVEDMEIAPDANQCLVSAVVNVEMEPIVEIIGRLLPCILNSSVFPSAIHFKMDIEDIFILRVKQNQLDLTIDKLSSKSKLVIPIPYSSKKYDLIGEFALYDLPFDCIPVRYGDTVIYVENDFDSNTVDLNTPEIVEGKLGFDNSPLQFYKSLFYKFEDKNVYFLPKRNTTIFIKITIDQMSESDNENIFSCPFGIGLCNFLDLNVTSNEIGAYLLGIWREHTDMIGFITRIPLDLFIDTSQGNLNVSLLIYNANNDVFVIRYTNRMTDFSKRYTGYNFMVPIYHCNIPRSDVHLFEGSTMFVVLKIGGVSWRQNLTTLPFYIQLLINIFYNYSRIFRGSLQVLSSAGNIPTNASIEQYIRQSFNNQAIDQQPSNSIWNSIFNTFSQNINAYARNLRTDRIIIENEAVLDPFFSDIPDYLNNNSISNFL